MRARMFAMLDGTLDDYTTEEIEGDPINPPRTLKWSGRLWRRFYEFGRAEPISYLDVEGNSKAISRLLVKMTK